MSRTGKSFEIGGLVIPVTAAFTLRQRIETLGGRNPIRFANGASLRQIAWQKLRVTLSGDGWVPLGVDALDFASTMTLKCGLPAALRNASGVITLPAARRTDTGYTPFARAHLPTGDVQTAVALVGNVATCTTVAGAISYTVSYYPELTVWADPPAQDFDGAGAATSWELVLDQA